MTDKMKWSLVAIAGFLAVGIVSSLLITALKTDGSDSAPVGIAPTSSSVSTPVVDSSIQTTGTTQAEVSTSTSTTEPTVNWAKSIGEYNDDLANYFQQLGLPSLSNIRFVDADGDNRPAEVVENELKMSALLEAAGWVFVTLEPESEAYTTYYNSISATDPQLAELIESAATRHLNPIWTAGIIENCFADDPYLYLLLNDVGDVYPATDDPVGSSDYFENYDEIRDACVTSVVSDNYLTKLLSR